MGQLPTVVRDGKTWYVDSRLCQARNVANPHDFRDFDTDAQLIAFSSVTHRFVGTADQLEVEAHYDARELVGQPCWIESVESEHEETGVKYVIRFETGADAVAHADDLTSLLEELLYAEQTERIGAEYGKRAAKNANYGWAVDGDDDFLTVSTKVYRGKKGYTVLRSTADFSTNTITHDWN